MKYTRSFLLNSMHKDWYIFEAEKQTQPTIEVVLDFYDGDPDVLERCAFLAEPIPNIDTKLRNCKGVIGPVKFPEITGQPLPHPPHLVPHTPKPSVVLPACMPVCPAGTVGGTPWGPTSAGISSTGVAGVSGEPSFSSKRKL